MPYLRRDRDDLILPVASLARGGTSRWRGILLHGAYLVGTFTQLEGRAGDAEENVGSLSRRRCRPARRAGRSQLQSSTTGSSLNLQFDMPMTPSSSSRGGVSYQEAQAVTD